jgi:hypothetical protein
MSTWDILICSIVHRTEMLAVLLAEFDRQLQPGVGVHVYRDNIEIEYGDKCAVLLDSSDADYVSFFDDDDWPADDFVSAICEALEQQPDYVGFDVHYTEDGVDQVPVHHSLQHPGWVNNPEALYRDIVHFNPIRRELANEGRWFGGSHADRRWADDVRMASNVKTEVYIDRELMHYRKTGGVYTVPEPMADPPPAPDIGYVTWVS